MDECVQSSHMREHLGKFGEGGEQFAEFDDIRVLDQAPEGEILTKEFKPQLPIVNQPSC